MVAPEGRLGMSDVSPVSGISGLSFDSPFLSPLFFLSFYLPSPLALSVLLFFLLMVYSHDFFPENLRTVRLFCMALVEQLGNNS